LSVALTGKTSRRIALAGQRLAVAGLMMLLVGCQGATVITTDLATSPPTSTPAAARTAAPSSEPAASTGSAVPVAPTVTLVTAGDIGRCDSDADERTAELAATLPGTVLVLGDNAYEDGSRRQYRDCYAPSWGRLLERTLAVPGNHDHHTEGAEAFFDYFGSRAGPAGLGWYAETLGAWHLITLDSECDRVGGCERGSRQYEWLAAELADHPAVCTVIAFHRPRYSSGYHGDFDDVDPLWRLAVEAGADIVLNGHEHSYERLGPMDADGRADESGARVFITGTGGAPLRGFKAPVETSQIRIDDRFGELVLELADGSYRWAFRSTPDGTVEDEGSGACH